MMCYASPLQGTSSTEGSCSGLSVSLNCFPSVLRVSQSLVHTTSMAVSSWREREKDEVKEREEGGKVTSSAAADLLTGHYVLCNDTLDDIHFGQVATGEDLLLPSNTCISYSWRNHKANLQVLLKFQQIDHLIIFTCVSLTHCYLLNFCGCSCMYVL